MDKSFSLRKVSFTAAIFFVFADNSHAWVIHSSTTYLSSISSMTHCHLSHPLPTCHLSHPLPIVIYPLHYPPVIYPIHPLPTCHLMIYAIRYSPVIYAIHYPPVIYAIHYLLHYLFTHCSQFEPQGRHLQISYMIVIIHSLNFHPLLNWSSLHSVFNSFLFIYHPIRQPSIHYSFHQPFIHYPTGHPFTQYPLCHPAITFHRPFIHCQPAFHSSTTQTAIHSSLCCVITTHLLGTPQELIHGYTTLSNTGISRRINNGFKACIWSGFKRPRRPCQEKNKQTKQKRKPQEGKPFT